MILPIVAYGSPVLKTKAEQVDFSKDPIKEIIENMFATMYHARGVGLAAPQVGLTKRIFVVDSTPFADDDESLKDFKRVFINAEILEYTGEKWLFNEGCLSIPDIREDVSRPETILIRYEDENQNMVEETYSGIISRIIQHEYDHIEGKLFVEYLHPFKRQLIQKRLNNISRGDVSVSYKMKFPAGKRGR